MRRALTPVLLAAVLAIGGASACNDGAGNGEPAQDEHPGEY
jgi:hypothetical protein